MSAEYLDSEKCDSNIKTQVLVGRSAKNKGWALNLDDISDFIPVKKYEFDNCKIIIEDIISDCKIRINPRLFYLGTEISDYLLQLDEKSHVPLEIKYDKSYLNQQIEQWKNTNLDVIETELLVGKSFSSKGWALTKDVRAMIFPIYSYEINYPITVGEIRDFGKLNIQIRLFYKSKRLSEKLEELHNIDPNQKVDAKIVFDERKLPDYENSLDDFNLKPISIDEKRILRDYISGISIGDLCEKYDCNIEVIENLIIRLSDGEFDNLF